MKKSEIHNELRELNSKVEKKLATKMVDTKFSAPFEISRSNRSRGYVTKIASGNYYGYISIWFGFRVEVSITMHTIHYDSINVKYALYDAEEVPENEKEYVDIMSQFLFGLIRWVADTAYAQEYYPEMVPLCYDQEDFPFKFNHWSTAYEDMFLHEYSWSNKDEMKYMIDVWNSREFKKDRGDYSAWRG